MCGKLKMRQLFYKRGIFMKRILMVLCAVCMLFCMNACSGASDLPQKSTASEPSAAAKDEVFEVGEAASFKSLKITALELQESDGTDFFVPEEGNVFVGVNFEIENISEEEQAISSLLLFDAYANDIKCAYSLSANVVFGDGTLDGSLAPGKKLVGWYAVEVPRDWQQLELEVKPTWLSYNSAKFVFEK